MKMIELPEGHYVNVEWIEGLGPAEPAEFYTGPPLTEIRMASGQPYITVETVERIMAQIAEVLSRGGEPA